MLKYYQYFAKNKFIKSSNNNNNNIQENIPKQDKLDKLNLNIFPLTISIIANNYETTDTIPNNFYIQDNKLYQYNFKGTSPAPVNGNYYISLSDNSYYENKAWCANNGNLQLLENYFDGNKLIINLNESKENGTLIITDNFKIYTLINNLWISH